jgi:hypothetical protein
MSRTEVPSRRIGERVSIAPVSVSWLLPVIKRHRFGRRRGGIERFDGRIIDVSITGAAVEGPEHPSLSVGALVVLDAVGVRASVRIRRCQERAPERPCVYGVEFVELDRYFRMFLQERLRTGRPGEERWMLAR